MPPIIWLLHRRPKWALTLLFSIVLFCLRATIQNYHTLPDGFKWELEQLNLFTIVMFLSIGSYMRTLPEHNISAYAIGVLAGYVLFKYNQNLYRQRETTSGGSSHWPTWFRIYLTWSLASLSLVLLITNCFCDYLQRITSPESQANGPIMLFTFNHVIFSATYACLFLMMITDWRNNSLMKFFSSKLWKFLSKLNYAMMLTHWDLIQYDVSTAQTELVYYRLVYFKTFAWAYMTSMLLAVIIYLFVESPLDRLIRSRIMRSS